MKADIINSTVITLHKNNWKEYLERLEGCSVILWNYDGQFAGKVQGGSIVCFHDGIFDEDKMSEIRIFDRNQELHINRGRNNELMGRLRQDGEPQNSEPTKVVTYTDTQNIMYGAIAENENGEYSLLKEDRGIEVKIPGSFPTNQRVSLTIRNYIDYNEVGMAGYVDARFVELKSIDNEK